MQFIRIILSKSMKQHEVMCHIIGTNWMELWWEWLICIAVSACVKDYEMSSWAIKKRWMELFCEEYFCHMMFLDTRVDEAIPWMTEADERNFCEDTLSVRWWLYVEVDELIYSMPDSFGTGFSWEQCLVGVVFVHVRGDETISLVVGTTWMSLW